jgi:penicillin-binding protein 2
MVAAVASGGSLWKPLFVSKVQLIGEEPVYTAQPTAVSTLNFKPEVFKLIQDSMCKVTTDPNGTAHFIFEEWYKFQGTNVIVCGKTGTAQTGGASTKPQAWFVAFAPQDDPEIAVTVVVENSCEGSEVAAPIVRRIVEDYYHMPHSEWPPLWQSGCHELGE